MAMVSITQRAMDMIKRLQESESKKRRAKVSQGQIVEEAMERDILLLEKEENPLVEVSRE